jgi:hypothetical protein
VHSTQTTKNDYNLRSRGTLNSTTSSSSSITTRKISTTTTSLKPLINYSPIVAMKYNIVYYMKKIKANVSMLYLCSIALQTKLRLKDTNDPNESK